MPRESVWTDAHVDFLSSLLEEDVYQELSGQELSTLMSRQFHARITPTHVAGLLNRMRRPSDPLYRAVPYRKRGAKFNAWG